MRGLSVLADYFILGAGFANVQVRALADHVLETARRHKVRRLSTEGYDESRWILVDYGDVVVHLMTHECWDYYRLDRLWGDAPRVPWELETEDKNRISETNETEKE